MDYAWTDGSVAGGNIVWLAAYRRRLSEGDDEPPPKPARARAPVPPLSTSALAGWRAAGGRAEGGLFRRAGGGHGDLAA